VITCPVVIASVTAVFAFVEISANERGSAA
jgi:hypothetical protein